MDALDDVAQALRAAGARFDADGRIERRRALDAALAAPLAAEPALVRCHDALLFLAAHPTEAAQARKAQAALARIAQWSQRAPRPLPDALVNQGLPFAPTRTRFTHDCLRWLLAHPHLRVELERCDDARLDLNDVLRLTLPTLERAETTAGHDPDALLQALGVPARTRLAFIVEQLAAFDAQPETKDLLCDGLGLQVALHPTRRAFSRAFNRLPMQRRFVHGELLKRFDHRALLDQPLPPPRAMDAAERAEAIRVLKNTMALTVRETDPATYLDDRQLFVWDLERGLTVALFGMLPARQLPLESYVGMTLFKNGWPAAYGGSWLLAPGAQFGMNIFEPFRGGESGYMMCQLLRTYRQAFGIDHFEVDGYQFGRDNPDGIASGAFWFYHRFGFRPVDAALAQLAAREQARMQQDPAHRSSARTLRRLAQSNVVLRLAPGPMPQLAELSGRVTEWITTRHGGHRQQALHAARAPLDRAAPPSPRAGADEHAVRAEMALLAAALELRDADTLRRMATMARTKLHDPRRYQRQLRQWFARVAPVG